MAILSETGSQGELAHRAGGLACLDALARSSRADLARLLAVSTPHREGVRLQALLGDLAAALRAVPVCTARQPHKRVTRTAERRDPHLEDGDADVLLEVGIRGLGRVQSSARLSTVTVVRTDIAELQFQLPFEFA